MLQIILAYFECHSIFYKGKDSRNHSSEFFKDAFLSVFPNIKDFSEDIVDQIIDVMYKDGRCGLFHIGMTRSRIILSDGKPVFRIDIDESKNILNVIYIDRYKIVDAVENHLERYVTKLRDPQNIELRNNFKKAWEMVHK